MSKGHGGAVRGAVFWTAIAALCALPAAARADGSSRLAVDVALAGTASASSAQDAHPAASAIDGSASTSWCPSGAPASLTVDLGRPRRLTGLGLTLDAASGPGPVSVQPAMSRDRRGHRWTPVGHDLSFPTGQPEYVRVARAARLVRLTTSSAACVGELRAFAHDPGTSGMALGADISFTRQEEAAGNTFTDDGRAAPVERILRRHGANYVRLRLWTAPPPGYSDLASDLAMAKRVKAAGMKLYLDIHYSDFWADPQHQITPAAWQGQDLPTLAQTVRDYTRQVIAAFAAQGTPVDLVSIGNEIRNGLLWPTGQIEWGTNERWAALGELLKAGVAGAREGSPAGHRPLIMLHFDQGGDNWASRYFFDHLVAQGVPFDVIGLSYYPFWHGTLSALRANLDDLATRYGKQVMIAEHQYAWTLTNGDAENDFVWTPDQLSPGYPASPAGQLSMASDILSILARVPDHRGAGFFYWEPEWIPGVGWQPGAGTPNDNLTLFDFHGAALPSIAMFGDPVS